MGDRMGIPLFGAGPLRAFEIGAADVPTLQRFFEANPEYHLAVTGEAPGPDEAQHEFDAVLLAQWPYEKKWLLGFVDESGSMIGMAAEYLVLVARDRPDSAKPRGAKT